MIRIVGDQQSTEVGDVFTHGEVGPDMHPCNGFVGPVLGAKYSGASAALSAVSGIPRPKDPKRWYEELVPDGRR